MDDPGGITLRHEMIRKTIHLLSMAIPAGYYLLPRQPVLIGTGLLLGFAVFVEISRFTWPAFAKTFYGVLGNLLRPHERTGLTGSTYLLLGAFFSILFFDKSIALAAILFLCISDALSGLVGRKWGKIKITQGRTLEGTIIFAAAALLIIVLLPNLHIVVGLSGVVSALLIDLLVKAVNDNLAIPLGAGLIMQIVFWIVIV